MGMTHVPFCLALAHILTCTFVCAQDSMEAPMAMAAKVTALQVGVTGLRCCRTFRPRCRTPAVGPRRACPPGWLP